MESSSSSSESSIACLEEYSSSAGALEQSYASQDGVISEASDSRAGIVSPEVSATPEPWCFSIPADTPDSAMRTTTLATPSYDICSDNPLTDAIISSLLMHLVTTFCGENEGVTVDQCKALVEEQYEQCLSENPCRVEVWCTGPGGLVYPKCQSARNFGIDGCQLLCRMIGDFITAHEDGTWSLVDLSGLPPGVLDFLFGSHPPPPPSPIECLIRPEWGTR